MSLRHPRPSLNDHRSRLKAGVRQKVRRTREVHKAGDTSGEKMTFQSWLVGWKAEKEKPTIWKADVWALKHNKRSGISLVLRSQLVLTERC